MAKQLGYSSTLKIGANTIAQIKEISGPSRSADSVDVTTLDSPNRYREFIAGLKDGGEVSFTVVYDPSIASHAALNTSFESGAVEACEIGLTLLARKLTFNASITGLGVTIPVDDAITQEVTLKVSGPVAIANI